MKHSSQAWESSTQSMAIKQNLRGHRIAKRILDLLVASILLILISPLWVFIVLWIRIDSQGPALFKQTRIGLGGRPFTIFKFRTMVTNADEIMKQRLKKMTSLDKDFVFQEKDDPRITRSGHFLRKTSLDELPQLINIILGEMSLVGPRPEIPEITKHYTVEQFQRLSVPPGVTGLAQVNGRSELNLGETIAYDLQYIEKWNFWFDLKILWKTFFVVLRGKDAY
jgi:exopolysaccharide biosynthesis polyprenyl glycosylphosphotransferase